MTESGVRVVGADEPRARRGLRRRRPEGEPAPNFSVPPERQRTGGRRATTALAVVAVAGVAGTIGFGAAWYHDQSASSAQSAARTAAEHFAYALTNFDAKSIDADFSSIQSMATGQFSQQAKQFFNGTIRQQLQAAKASTRGQIRYLYAQSFGGGKASYYALVDQTYANVHTSGPQTDELRLVIDEEQVSGQWKISNLTELSGPSVGGAGATGSTKTTTPGG